MKPVTVKAMTSSQKQDWGTPQVFFDYFQKYLGYNFTLDACASEDNFKVPYFYTEEINAFNQVPLSEKIWMNPPYARGAQTKFVELAIKWSRHNVVWCLIPARTDTKLFHDTILPNANQIIFIKGRIQHEGANGGALMPQMLVQFDYYFTKWHRSKIRFKTLEPTPKERGF